MKTKSAASSVRHRALIVDDHPMMRYGVGQLLAQEADMTLCGEAENMTQALVAVKDLKPDLVLTDLTLPGRSGLEFIKDMHALHPGTSILVVSMHDEMLHAERALRAGASGYIMKTEPPQTLLRAIRQVVQGKLYVSQRLSARVLDAFASQHNHVGDPVLAALTDREFEVFQLIAQGSSTKEIAGRLNLSAKTVETHRQHIKAKLRLGSGQELVQYAVRWGAAQGML